MKISAYQKDHFLVTCIEDKGIGISEKELPKLFAIDSHLQHKDTDNEKGTGLGLILCKEFVTKNHGKIWAEGKEKEGCKFSFTLPLYKPEQTTAI